MRAGLLPVMMRPSRRALRWATALAVALAVPASAAEPVLHLGIRQDAPPFASRAEGATAAENDPLGAAYTGFSVDICREIVATLQTRAPALRIEHMGVTAQTRFTETGGPSFDILCDPTSITVERLDICSFSFAYFVTGIGYVAAEPAEGIEALAAQPVALVGNTTAESRISEDWQARYGTPPKLHRMENYGAAVAALEAGDVRAIVGDQVLLQRALEDAGSDRVLGDEILSVELYGFCVRPDRPELLAAANATLADLYRSGRIYQILSQHFDGHGASRILANLYTLHAIPVR